MGYIPNCADGAHHPFPFITKNSFRLLHSVVQNINTSLL